MTAFLLLALCQTFFIPPATAISASDYFTFSYQVTLNRTEVNQGETFTALATGSATCKQVIPITVSSATINSRVVASNVATGAKVVLNPSYSVVISPFPQVPGAVVQLTKEIPLSFPANADPGSYTVTGELIQATLQAGGPPPISLPATAFLPATQPMGNVRYVAASTPAPGGGGAGAAPQPTPSPTPSAPAPPPANPTTFTALGGAIDSTGVVTTSVSAASADQKSSLQITPGTKALNSSGGPLSEIVITPTVKMPAPPPQSSIMGTPYDFGPDGATFDPPLTLTFNYDVASLPKGISESHIRPAWFRSETGGWVVLPDAVIDTAKKQVIARVGHFTTFGVIAYPPPAFKLGDSLSIEPKEPLPGDQVKIGTTVSNTGGLEGTYQVNLKIDGKQAETRELTLQPGQTLPVSFSVKGDAGSHTVDLNGLTGSFKVLSPARFSVSTVTVSPETALPGGEVSITATIANAGDVAGIYEAILKIDNSTVAIQQASVDGKSEKKVTFKQSRDSAGSYRVDIGGVTGVFSVKLLPPPEAPSAPTPSAAPQPAEAPSSFNPWIAIAGVVIVVAATGYFLLRRNKPVAKS